MSVGDVLRELQRKRPVAYTTAMTILDKMARKGSLGREKKGKAYYYSPLVNRSQVLGCLVQEFADCYCGGDKKQIAPFLGKPSTGGQVGVKNRKPGRVKTKGEESERADSGDLSGGIDVVLL